MVKKISNWLVRSKQILNLNYRLNQNFISLFLSICLTLWVIPVYAMSVNQCGFEYRIWYRTSLQDYKVQAKSIERLKAIILNELDSLSLIHYQGTRMEEMECRKQERKYRMKLIEKLIDDYYDLQHAQVKLTANILRARCFLDEAAKLRCIPLFGTPGDQISSKTAAWERAVALCLSAQKTLTENIGTPSQYGLDLQVDSIARESATFLFIVVKTRYNLVLDFVLWYINLSRRFAGSGDFYGQRQVEDEIALRIDSALNKELRTFKKIQKKYKSLVNLYPQDFEWVREKIVVLQKYAAAAKKRDYTFVQAIETELKLCN